jgi:DNA-binding CsgD family transcriptional regulator
VARYLTDFERADALYRESAEVRHEIGDPWGLLLCIEGLAAVAAMRGNFQRAARLSGACAAQRQTLGAPLTPDEQEDFEETRLAAAKALGSDAFEREWQAGQALGLDEALALALESYTDSAASPAPSSSALSPSSRTLPAGQLSRRERQVAGLVATGLTNREIAERLVLSERTIDAHVEHIRNKLGVRSRALIATWAEAQGLRAPQSEGE